jgi:hypothetical protein
VDELLFIGYCSCNGMQAYKSRLNFEEPRRVCSGSAYCNYTAKHKQLPCPSNWSDKSLNLVKSKYFFSKNEMWTKTPFQCT